MSQRSWVTGESDSGLTGRALVRGPGCAPGPRTSLDLSRRRLVQGSASQTLRGPQKSGQHCNPTEHNGTQRTYVQATQTAPRTPSDLHKCRSEGGHGPRVSEITALMISAVTSRWPGTRGGSCLQLARGS